MNFIRRLRSRGFKITPQRKAVFEVLTEHEGSPMDPERIHRMAIKKYPALGLTTVYRTLELFCDLGIALPVHLHEDSQYYELNTGSHHHHLVCVSCGEVQMSEICLMDEIEDLVRDRSDFLITSHCMTLFGFCPDCHSAR